MHIRTVMKAALALAVLLPGTPALAVSTALPTKGMTQPQPDKFVKAPPFSLKTLDGQRTVKSSQFKGKVLVVNIWASWCPPCRRELPVLSELQENYQDQGVEVIGLATDRTPKAPLEAWEEAGANYTSLFADPEVLSGYGALEAIPMTFIVDRDGNVVQRLRGRKDLEVFEEAIKPYL